MRFFIFIFFIHFLYADDTILSRIKACSNGKNLTCKLIYEPEFIAQDNNLVFQKRYQACFSSLDSLKNISQSSFWLYNPISQRKHIYPKLDLVSFGMSLNEADLFLLEIENDKKPRLNIRCAYISYKNKQGLLVEHSLG